MSENKEEIEIVCVSFQADNPRWETLMNEKFDLEINIIHSFLNHMVDAEKYEKVKINLEQTVKVSIEAIMTVKDLIKITRNNKNGIPGSMKLVVTYA